jgi:hypothetical protein
VRLEGKQMLVVQKRALVLCAAALVLIAFVGFTSAQVRPGEGNLTYARGQSISPVYQGWTENADGSFNLHFSYLNQNWEEELDVPIGAGNIVEPAPYGPDAGQPTHFYPRLNRWQFTVRVPKDFGTTNEVIWTVTSHGVTNRAYGTLAPGYAMDEYLIQFEFGGTPIRGRKPPTIQLEGAKQRTVKVGQPVALVAVAQDDPAIAARGRGRGGAGGGGGGGGRRGGDAEAPRSPNQVGPGDVGGDFIRATAPGLRLAWLVYRGDARKVTFDPPIPFKVWEDQRGGSPWSPGWQAPPVPPGNRWTYNATFAEPGTYVLRALAHTGSTFAYENVTFTVTP